MTLRIVVTGPECTGKTTLAGQLAEAFDAPWVPEAARGYAEEAAEGGHGLTVDDVMPIARRQMAAEDAALAGKPKLVVLDTDLISTVVYARHYYGLTDPALSEAARDRRGALYLLCRPDLPWSADGVRDRPLNRDEMFQQFADALGWFGASVHRIEGLGESRLGAAMRAVETLPGVRAIT